MSRDYDFVTFDCYGTLVDWEGGISAAFSQIAASAKLQLSRKEILAAHAEIEPLVEAERFRSYREVLVETAQRMARTFGFEIGVDAAAALPESLPGWELFSDTNPALRRLREAGYSLGILSNVDDDLLYQTMRRLDAGFELRVTAQQVRSYKPAAAHFERAAQEIGDRRWLHVAQSWFHDIVPATQRGLPSIWINRHRERPGELGSPLHEFVDLTALADFLA
jgi:2-haloalkanoic acid dehalogenase type II